MCLPERLFLTCSSPKTAFFPLQKYSNRRILFHIFSLINKCLSLYNKVDKIIYLRILKEHNNLVGSLSDDDGDGNKDGNKAICLY